MTKRVYGYKKTGEPITDETIASLVDEAERGYEPGQLEKARRGRGRPPHGDAVKVVGSLRIDPALRREAEVRASSEGVSVSELVRRALREYLHTS